MGSATLKTIVRKNLILRLAVPRFFVQGDEVVISALVHNYLTTDKTARVSLDVKGLDVLDGATKDVRIPSRGEVKVDWRVRAQQVRSATSPARRSPMKSRTRCELELPVNVPGVKLSALARRHARERRRRVASTSRSRQSAARLAFAFHPLSPSIAGSLFGALEYLTSFPYGCVEQTMSSFLPNIIVQQAVQRPGLKENLDEAALQEKIRAGLDRLYSFQHEDGGWGWWETDESHPFMTAYVVAGLVQAQAAGTQVNQDDDRQGRRLAPEEFRRAIPNSTADLRAYMRLRAGRCAGHRRTITTRLGIRRALQLSPYGLALLGLALEQAKDTRAADTRRVAGTQRATG